MTSPYDLYSVPPPPPDPRLIPQSIHGNFPVAETEQMFELAHGLVAQHSIGIPVAAKTPKPGHIFKFTQDEIDLSLVKELTFYPDGALQSITFQDFEFHVDGLEDEGDEETPENQKDAE